MSLVSNFIEQSKETLIELSEVNPVLTEAAFQVLAACAAVESETKQQILHPMYRQTAAYGHFGRNPYEMTVGNDTFTAFTWERTDKADALREAAGL